MGIYGSVVIFPDDQPKKQARSLGGWFRRSAAPQVVPARASHTFDLDATTRAAVQAFESVGLVPRGTSKSVEIDSKPTFATCAVTEEPPTGLRWAHAAVDAAVLSPDLSELVFTMTEAELAEALSMKVENPTALALPSLSVSVFSRPIDLTNEVSTPNVVGWAFVELNFEDCRLSDDIHRIRNEDHPLFSKLSEVFGCQVRWGVVGG
jgi:hypothetical protein